MIRTTSLAVAALCAGTAPAVSAVASVPAVTAWTVPEAVRAVALGRPELALPKGMSVSALRMLPLDSPVWASAARLLPAAAVGALRPESMVRYALERTRALAQSELLAAESRPPDAALNSARRDAESPELAPPGDPGAVVAQAAIQRDKNVFRTLAQYSMAIRSGGFVHRPAAGSGLVLTPAPALERAARAERTVEALISELRREPGPVIWADVGGGIGGAQRVWSKEELGADVRRVLVDLIDWESTHHDDNRPRLRDEVMAPEHRPELRLADAVSVSFAPGAKPRLITTVESVQYWPDKLRVIANLYNQLADGGILVIAAAENWPAMLRGRDAGELPFAALLKTLARGGAELAALGRMPDPDSGDIRSLIVRKAPGSSLEVRSPAPVVVHEHGGYSSAHYGRGADGLFVRFARH